MAKQSETPSDLDTWVYGAAAIGAVIGLTKRQAGHALSSGYISADKFGKKWRSTKRRLMQISTTSSPIPAAPPPTPAPRQTVAARAEQLVGAE